MLGRRRGHREVALRPRPRGPAAAARRRAGTDRPLPTSQSDGAAPNDARRRACVSHPALDAFGDLAGGRPRPARRRLRAVPDRAGHRSSRSTTCCRRCRTRARSRPTSSERIETTLRELASGAQQLRSPAPCRPPTPPVADRAPTDRDRAGEPTAPAATVVPLQSRAAERAGVGSRCWRPPRRRSCWSAAASWSASCAPSRRGQRVSSSAGAAMQDKRRQRLLPARRPVRAASPPGTDYTRAKLAAAGATSSSAARPRRRSCAAGPARHPAGPGRLPVAPWALRRTPAARRRRHVRGQAGRDRGAARRRRRPRDLGRLDRPARPGTDGMTLLHHRALTAPFPSGNNPAVRWLDAGASAHPAPLWKAFT